MNDTVEKTSEDKKDSMVVVNREKYQTQRSPSGGKSISNGDLIATCLVGMSSEQVFEIGDKCFKDNDFRARYAKLNTGMQRMNIGNRIRGWLTKRDADNEKLVAEEKTPKSSGEEALMKFCSKFRKDIDAATEKADKEKLAKKEAAAAKKAAAAPKKEAAAPKKD